MPAVLSYKASMLLAKERVNDIHKVLKAKRDNGAALTTLDRQLLSISKATLDIFQSEPRPRTDLKGLLFVEPIGADVQRYPISQYAVLGSIGPEITAYSEALNPNEKWVQDTIHKGTPDKNRELVNAQSCDFVMHFWDEVKNDITTTISNPDDRNIALQKMRAYTLGHLCHVATDIISSPYFNDFEWQGAAGQSSELRARLEGEIEAYVCTELLQRDNTLGGNEWDKWWPEENLPESFFKAYAQAFETTYMNGGEKRSGYKEYELALESMGSAIAMNASFVKDGYDAFRKVIISKNYGYGYWSWFGWSSLFFAPAILLPLVVAAMPHARHIFLADGSNRNERAWMEYLSTPLLFGLPAAIGFAFHDGIVPRGLEGQYWLGVGGSIASAVAGAAMLVTTFVDDLPPGLSWPLFFALPVALSGLQSVIATIAEFENNTTKRNMALIHSAPLAMLALFFIFFGIFPGLLAPAEGADSPFTSAGFWIAFVLWVIAMGAAWFLVPHLLKNKRIPEQAQGGIAGSRFVRLFDDTTLHHEQALSDLDIPATVYPSDMRDLIKLWWTGSGDLYVRCDRYQLIFSSHEDGRDPQIVSAPITPMTLQEYIDFLKNTVVTPGTTGPAGGLEASIVHSEDPSFLLPAGALFADHGDAEESVEEHDEKAAVFKSIGKSEADSDYVLTHSHRAAQSIRYGKRGPIAIDRGLGSTINESSQDEEGWAYLYNQPSAKFDDSLMSIAADFGALLSMSASTHIVPDLKDSNDNDVGKVYQVFKNWNLDRRRLNEWRTLVSGNAINERDSTRPGYTENMLGGSLRPSNHGSWEEALKSDQSAFDEGERTARELGWTKVLREWMDVARDTGQDTLATSSFKPGQPSNQALSRAMAYLFDLPDPTAAPSIDSEGGS